MIIYLSLGTNTGVREQNLQKAIYELKNNKEIHLCKYSSIFESEPVGYKNQSWFLNAVIEIDTNLKPYELLKLIKVIEKQIGRKRTYRWGPRIIDIDILSYENKILKIKELTVPHPEMHLRKFVLIPLAEIAPFYIHPKNKLSVWQMIQQCPDNQVYWRTMFNA